MRREMQLALAASREHAKTAEVDELANVAAALQAMQAQEAQRQALLTAGKVGLGGLAVGGVSRGLLGLMRLGKRNLGTPVRNTNPSFAQFGLPAEEEDKLAADGMGGLGGFLSGEQASTPSGVPWAMPAALGAGVGGLAGGWGLIDWLMDKQRGAEKDRELEQAKQMYEQALSGQVKGASDNPVALKLDELCDELEKKGFDFGDASGKAVGAYGGLYALPSMVVAALAAHNYAKGKRKSTLLRKAMRRRAVSKQRSSPPALLGVMEPVPGNASPTNEDEDPFQPAPSLLTQEDRLD